MMEEEMEKVVVVGLIEKATNSTAVEVDPRLLKAIKSVVRFSDMELRFAAQTLMSLMKRDHSQVRYMSLLIIDELFMRSKLFRTLIVENLDLLLSLSVGFRRNHPLPDPASVATVMRSKAIEFLEKWNESFGIQYRQLRLGYDYLKNNLRFQFPNLQANAARIQQERRTREMRTKEILLKKFEFLRTNILSIKEEIQVTIDEIVECLDILVKKDEDISLAIDDEEMEEFRNSELRQIRHDSLREGEKVHENSENEVVFDALREMYKVLVTKHLAAIQEWTSVLIRVEVEDNSFKNSTLKDLIDIKNLIHMTKTKCEESGCDLSKIANSEEEDMWEDGTVEISEEGKSAPSCSKSNDHSATTSNDVRDSRCNNNLSNGNKKKNRDNSGSELNPLRSKLFAEAPVLNWGSSLDNWGSNRDVLANQRGLDLDSHWGRVDYDAVIPSEKIAELNVHASVYKEDPVEIHPCRAPLRNGGLCQRRDLKICPFHGLIISRDDDGKPIHQSPLERETSSPQSHTEDSTPEMDTATAEQLLKQAVKNVRERDRDETKMKDSDKRALKRAKLAKVREHNEAVMRDAALATTWRSAHIGEGIEIGNGSRSSAKAKKQTLASMLKKKGTAKDRLSRRLLNSRAC
ncbi:hypothetical protein RD792_004453 [Penstemon davidsonii]|uniref:UV-stimulated scaffold protein A C-terminal domain-containing protein n=1 Tax=Penstemon davidsonii TaxID=160366 RepID=A0ABR0DHG5_9LAMI|nr:hypothetical protein RD792_004453 [Penstemon davidsonii]